MSAIACECFVWPVPRTQMHAGLIAFHGAYTPGSAGIDDALFISWRIRELCEIQRPVPISGLLVDFRDLEYDDGDDLSVDGSRLDQLQRPILVVIRPEQREAFRAVVGDYRLRTDLEEAAAEVSDILRGLRPPAA